MRTVQCSPYHLLMKFVTWTSHWRMFSAMYVAQVNEMAALTLRFSLSSLVWELMPCNLRISSHPLSVTLRFPRSLRQSRVLQTLESASLSLSLPCLNSHFSRIQKAFSVINWEWVWLALMEVLMGHSWPDRYSYRKRSRLLFFPAHRDPVKHKERAEIFLQPHLKQFLTSLWEHCVFLMRAHNILLNVSWLKVLVLTVFSQFKKCKWI